MDTPLEPDPYFWNALVDVGALDPELVAEYRARRRRPWRQLGEILIRQGVLTVKQVAGLLQMQVDEPGMRIGDLALREGLIDEQALERALRTQRDASPHPLELMAEDERLERRSLFHALIAYVRHVEGQVHSLRAQRDSAPVARAS